MNLTFHMDDEEDIDVQDDPHANVEELQKTLDDANELFYAVTSLGGYMRLINKFHIVSVEVLP